MQSLVSVLDSEMGQSMRVYGCTFLWFIPFVRSIMELQELNASYISEIIHYLCDKIRDNRYMLTGQADVCDKVTELFARIFIQIIELHFTEGRMGILSRCPPKWVEVIVMCVVLSDEPHGPPDRMGGIHSVSSTSYNLGIVGRPTSECGNGAIIKGCLTLIRQLLKEGKRRSDPDAAMFLNLLNKQLRGDTNKRWSLTFSNSAKLQQCLRKIVQLMAERPAIPPRSAPSVEAATNTVVSRHSVSTCQQQEDQEAGPSRAAFIKEEPLWNYGKKCFSNEEFSCGPKDVLKSKKEPSDPVLISELRPAVELTNIKPDLGKVQEIRSRLNDDQSFSKIEAIARKKSGVSAKKRPCFGVTKNEEDDYDDDDDEPLHITRTRLIKSAIHKLESSDSDVDCRATGSAVNSKQNVESGTIVISDDEDSDNDIRPNDPLRSSYKECAVKNQSPESPVMPESPGRDYDDLSESQVFEFETQQYVASAWDNTDLDGSVLTKKLKSDRILKPQLDEAPDEASPSWSSETELVPDEDIERACQQAEEKIRQQQPRKPADEEMERDCKQAEEEIRPQQTRETADLHASSSKASSTTESWDKFAKPKPLKTKRSKNTPSDKRDHLQDKKPLLIDALAQKMRRHPWKRSSTSEDMEEPSSSTTPSSSAVSSSSSSSSPSSSSNTSPYFSASTSRSTPAIVPPKKVRKIAEPESTAERLGLKKKERKAFDLSQRSLDCVAKLRCHGQKVQVEPHQKKRRACRTTKTSPQKRMVKANKKLMGSQDIQFFRQSREKHQKPATEPITTSGSKPATVGQLDELHSSRPTVANNEAGDFLPCPQPDPQCQHDNAKSAPGISDSRGDGDGNNKTIIQSKFFQASEAAEGNMEGEEAAQASKEDVDDEWMFYTQMEPTDMEICSQMEQFEDENEEIFLTQKDPVDMDIDTDSGSDTPGQPDLTDKNVQTPKAANDHLFLKPGMSPMSQKKAKPSTTKIYTPSSRSASLVLEMEKGAKPPPPANVAKAKIPRLPPAMPPPAMPPPKMFQPLPPPQLPKPPALKQVTLPQGSVPKLVTSNKISSTSEPPSYKVYQRPEAPVNKPLPTMDQSPKFDLSVLTQAILKWEYRMLDNYKAFGSPLDLCQLPLKEVPVNFPTYLEYFNTLYPLLLINAFEEVGLRFPSVMHKSFDVIGTAFLKL